jgi:DNA ligase-associated metallophosphoesterase
MADDLERLATLIDTTGAERLVVLGDFFHADPDPAEPFLDAFREWRRVRSGLAVSCVIGNHDRHGGYRCLGDCLEWLPDPTPAGPFALRHDPEPVDHGYVLAGHLHPVVRLLGPGGDRLRLPVFWFGARTAVLPAFGSFTGGARVSPVPGDRVFAVGPGGIVDVSPGEAIRHG